MRENNLRARWKRKRVKTTDSSHKYPVADNILNRDFHAEEGGMKWVSDICYLRTVAGWLYLTVILDLWDRKVIGWSMSKELKTETVCAALEMAVLNRPHKEGLIFHSDRGVQYCSDDFRKTLKCLCPAAFQSMSRKGNCWDNACAESFFKTLKTELKIPEGGYSYRQMQSAVFEYIEIYYNRCRRHSTLGYVAPVEVTNNFVA
jgi:transposase InsO family protein